ncbi:MAG: alanine--glyoxylate aminotransferase family protein [Planctomycetes bacterium]|nr:alanine--glyoxylate aminotransferase family protein [Planctomycetota bacterium]
MSDRPLLMIPGPIEISPAVCEAAGGPPPGHLSPAIMEAFGRALAAMRQVWRASADSQPFILPGSGTLAMESAVQNLVDAGDRVVLVNTGYFSDRMGEMLRRRGADLVDLKAEPGCVPDQDEVEAALAGGPTKALFATHVDTSTAVRTDARALAAAARRHGTLSIFDGVCATAAERFEMESWGADVYLTASQKAIGLPAGLALLVAGPGALRAFESLKTRPAMTLDWQAWIPVMRAYEEGRPAYFATPPTNLVRALDVGLAEILAQGADVRTAMDACFAAHERTAAALRGVWKTLGLHALPARPELAANTLSALRYPKGMGPEVVAAIGKRGVIVAGGLHQALAKTYFRVGHMGWVITQPDQLARTVSAVAAGVGGDEAAALATLRAGLAG